MAEESKKLSRRDMLQKAALMVGVAGSSALAASCAQQAPPPPPPVAQAAPPPPPPPVAQPMPAPAPPPPERQTKREAHYQWQPHRGERCGGCVHFAAPNRCEIVEGRISPRGWCRNYMPRA